MSYLDMFWDRIRGLFGSDPLPDIEPDKKPPDTHDCRTAVHEAGHVLAGWYCTAVKEMVSATIDPEGKTAGVVRFKIARDGSTANRWCEAVIKLAGPAAECLFYGSFRGAEMANDLLSAREVLKGMDTEPPWASISGSVPRFDLMFTEPMRDTETEALKQAYLRSKQILVLNQRAHAKVVSALLAQRTIYKSDMEVLLGHRRVQEMLGFLAATFVV